MREDDKPGTDRSRRGAHGRALALCVLGLLCMCPAAGAAAQDWVGPLSRLSPPDWSLTPRQDDPRSLAERIEIARRLGRDGPPGDAIELLLSALEGELDPALRDEVLHGLARRGSAAAVAPAVALLRASETPIGAAFLLLSAVADRPAVLAAIAELGRPAMAAQARWALLRAGDLAPFPLVQALVAGGDGALDEAGRRQHRVEIAATLGQLGLAAAAQPLLTRLGSARHPSERAALLSALGALAEADALDAGARTATADAAIAALSDSDPAARRAALEALAHAATGAHVPALRPLLQEADTDVQAAALRAIALADPAAAAAPLRAALSASDKALAHTALELLVGQPHRAWVSLLRAQLAGTPVERAANALSRVEGGHGLPSLLQAAAELPDRAAVLSRAVALCLRRHPGGPTAERRDAALRLLRGLPAGPRRLRLRALAGDSAVIAAVRSGLLDADAGNRAAAAQAAEYLAAPGLSAPVVDALAAERDAESFRRLADAALRLGAPAVLGVGDPRLRDAATAPEALLLLGGALGGGRVAAANRAAAGIQLRRALHGADHTPARTRAAAALALGLSADPHARTPLLSALDDPDDRIRRAAVSALRHLAARTAMPVADRLRPFARVERGATIHAALRAALTGPPQSSELPWLRGAESMDVRVGAQPRAGGVLLDVLTGDGRWRRMRTGEQGELIVTDLPAGVAQVAPVP